MTAPVPTPAARASLIETIKAVGASFFGVRSRSHHEQDMARLDPRVVIATGIVLAGVFVPAPVPFARKVVPS